jgi:hypothetical protein
VTIREYPNAQLTTGEAQAVVLVVGAAIEDESDPRTRRLLASALEKLRTQLSGIEKQ